MKNNIILISVMAIALLAALGSCAPSGRLVMVKAHPAKEGIVAHPAVYMPAGATDKKAIATLPQKSMAVAGNDRLNKKIQERYVAPYSVANLNTVKASPKNSIARGLVKNMSHRITRTTASAQRHFGVADGGDSGLRYALGLMLVGILLILIGAFLLGLIGELIYIAGIIVFVIGLIYLILDII